MSPFNNVIASATDKARKKASETDTVNIDVVIDESKKTKEKTTKMINKVKSKVKNKIPPGKLPKGLEGVTDEMNSIITDVLNHVNTVNTTLQSENQTDITNKVNYIESLIKMLLDSFSDFMLALEDLYNIYETDKKITFKNNLVNAISSFQPSNNSTNTIQDIIAKFIQELDSLYQTLFEIYTNNKLSIKDLTSHTTTITKYEDILKNITSTLQRQVNILGNSAITNARRSDYEYRNIDYLDYIKWWLFVVYIILVLLYCAFGPFVRNEEYDTYIGWAKTLSLIISAFIPFYIAWFIEIVYNYIVKLFNSIVDRHVYSINQNESPLKLKTNMITNFNILNIPKVNTALTA